ncbi:MULTISPECIES: lipopolysaccharide biosynthesis protein [Bacteroides]|uniref:lipopolysaccharide biosynthesis protein n=1 Tax=Bacteroides TaxID=816 RepID=UPI00112462A0|nr:MULTISPECIES: lipopolysaccharide biosynthesis protein [Bacteroides]MBM6944088.1 lipopolysaccharide biosynthesis protein [Bacteroides gallinaceum]
MPHTTTDNKRIAKNTLALYVRMILSTLVSLYTSRVVLNTLGVVDYGIYNVVGGIVVMFAFLNSTMAVSTQRFLSYDIGRNDSVMMNKTFNIAMVIHIMIGIFVILLGETVGLWFLYNKMIIPVERMTSALWVYHLSLVSFFFSVTQVPYSACINSHEKMDIFAYFGILDVLLKLAIVFLLRIGNTDKLILYAILMFTVTLLMRIIYRWYCIKQFKETKLQLVWNTKRFHDMLGFAGWNSTTHFSLVARTQGVNILINLFFGPALNAARGVATTVSMNISSFANNFILAIIPQTVKLYANGNVNDMNNLVIKGCKYSFLLLYFISFPMIIEANYVMTLWLKNPPEMSVLLCRLVLCSALIDNLSTVIGYGPQAVGRIKIYQTTMSCLFLMVPIITYVAYRLGYGVEMCIYSEIIIYICALFLRPLLSQKVTKLNIRIFFKESVFRNILVVLISMPIPIIIYINMNEGFVRLLIECITCVICTTLSILTIGLNSSERKMLISYISNRIHHTWNRMEK